LRLPTLTKEHGLHEDSRQHHEDLYAAFLNGLRIEIAVTPDTVHAVQLKQSGDYRRFWLARGFKIRTKRNADASILWVWLERTANQNAEAA